MFPAIPAQANVLSEHMGAVSLTLKYIKTGRGREMISSDLLELNVKCNNIVLQNFMQYNTELYSEELTLLDCFFFF